MTIQVGDKIPQATLNELKDGVQAVDTAELFGGRKVVLFAVPGAFTPTCSAKHLPGYVEKFDEFRARGIEVACMSVNDAFVMGAWARSQDVPEGLIMLADGNGAFAQAMGLEMDATAFGMGRTAGPDAASFTSRMTGAGIPPSCRTVTVARAPFCLTSRIDPCTLSVVKSQ